MPTSFTIGDLEVIVVSDGSATFPAPLYFRGTTAEHWEPHKRWLDHEGNVEFPFACFVIRRGGKTLLIDTGLGSLKMFTFTGGALLGELTKAGINKEDVDVVFVTHLHIDHCGTCTTSDGNGIQPVFPNAAYRWTSDEHEYWRTAPNPPGNDGFSMAAMLDALAERTQHADGGDALLPGVSVIATPGHTPGHAGVVVASGGERAFILGDAISCPVQLEETEWSGLGDLDPKLARQSQEVVAREAEASGALLTASHFPGLTFGRVLRGEGRRYWQPGVEAPA